MRTKKTIPWVIYLVCALAVLEGLGYASYKALDLQRQRRQDEAARLALWRMDSALTAVLAAESARPYFHYRPFHPAERAYNRMLGPVEPGEVLVPSPLLTRVPPFVRLHFEIGPDGRLTSPQAPDGNLRDLAESEYVAAADVIAAEALRLMLAELLPRQRDELAMGLPVDERIDADRFARQETAAAAQLAVSPQRQMPAPSEVADFAEAESSGRSQREAENTTRLPASRARRAPETSTATEQSRVELGPLSASWLAGEELVLMRDVRVGDTALKQGVWLDWPSLHEWLLGQVEDLAPGAKLRPGASASRSLAVIPAVIEMPGPAGLLGELVSPLGVVLMLTWTAALLAVIAIGVVLRLATSLAERRGRFVSAVTHELRTPMTSVRLYADLLTSDAASDTDRRDRFIANLQEESARLARIIENVLAYARLGRPHGTRRAEPMTVRELVDYAVVEHEAALDRAGLSVQQQVNGDVAGRRLDADGEAAVRVLGNLIENACKYAHPHERPSLEITIGVRRGLAMISVRDWGPGVPEHERRRIFEAFHRAERDEVRENGLGLGLALSRQLARQLGGSLELDHVEVGARFTLSLPLKP
ncbi:MAG: sensor histidine kinase [Phycisphaerales bacterium JB060]